MNTWEKVYANARKRCTICHCCMQCNGEVCRGMTPGPGGKGNGNAFVRNAEMLKKIFITMDTICDNEEIDTTSKFFNHPVALPVYAAPISGIQHNYGADIDDWGYTSQLVEGMLQAGSLAFSGDGMHDEMFRGPMQIIKEHRGYGIPTIKPWEFADMKWRMEEAMQGNAVAIATDIDASGLIHLKKSNPPIRFKNVQDLKRITAMSNVPVLVKGILSVKGALKAMDAGVGGIIVSNHGGRVLDACLSGIEVLEDIVTAVQGKMSVFVDGAFRNGNDIFKALALGANGVLIGRPISHAVIGNGSSGVQTYINKLQLELKEAMAMAGCKRIADITRENVIVKF